MYLPTDKFLKGLRITTYYCNLTQVLILHNHLLTLKLTKQENDVGLTEIGK